MEGLAGAILLKAIDDWRDLKKRPEVEVFLDSEWFEELTDLLELEASMIRNWLRQGSSEPLNIHAAYH